MAVHPFLGFTPLPFVYAAGETVIPEGHSDPIARSVDDWATRIVSVGNRWRLEYAVGSALFGAHGFHR